MYLEERVEQLANLSVDHGRQIDTVAKGLANLTLTVNQRFDQIDERFDRVEADIADLKIGQARLEADVTDLKIGQARLEATVTDIKNGQTRLESTVSELQQTQQLVLTLLQERLR